ncbi:hypothetical protein [Olivibacter domesticus]|uniref:Uncharacterized protein n=1 Tax=Olivibacter domesticus TaxID=407022 RepID=A0A1H7IC50_OLID1|nr:hypothetical protein [Olivibacter domesticus]SEK60143.1 hypothetical protein SAMN05661044_00655 [Olivibacter domesticus]
MKALNRMSISEKAELLHQFFPEEMHYLLAHIQEACRARVNAPQSRLDNWEQTGLKFERWMFLNQEIAESITANVNQIASNKKMFSKYLFRGDKALVTLLYMPIFINFWYPPESPFYYAYLLFFGNSLRNNRKAMSANPPSPIK